MTRVPGGVIKCNWRVTGEETGRHLRTKAVGRKGELLDGEREAY